MAKKDMFKACMVLLQEHKYPEARFILTSYIESRTDLGRYFAFASSCCGHLGWHRQAADFATAGITFDPKNAEAWYAASSSLTKMGQRSEASAVMERAPERARTRWTNLVHTKKPKKELAFVTFCTQDPSQLMWGEMDTAKMGSRLDSLAWYYWRNKDYEAAVNALRALIWSVSAEAKLALMMRSMCNHHCLDFNLAASDATVALMIDSGDDDAVRRELFLHRKTALAGMGQSRASKIMSDFSDAYFSQSRQKLFEKSIMSSMNPEKSKNTNTFEDDYLEEVTGKLVEEDANYGLVEMMLRALPEDQRKLLVDDRVPPLHVEFANGPSLHSSNQSLSLKWLQGAYAKSLTAIHSLRYEQMGAKEGLRIQEIARRLGPDREKSMKWWKSAHIGDIESQRARSIYPPDVLHTYSNVNPMQYSLAYGKLHIAVGHVDLGVLLSAEYVGDPADGPIEFIGYEASPYAVARTKILHQMLEDGADVDSVLQVAYSSGWSMDTLSSFRKALRNVLKVDSLPDQVHEILMRWTESPNVDLRTSQEMWLKLHDNERYAPANIVCKDDRMKVMHYMVSGRLLDCAVGSITMFVLPSDIPHVANEESIFSLVFPEQLAKEYVRHHSVIDTIIGILRSRIRNLQDNILAKQVCIESKLKRIDLLSPSELADLRSKAPDSISWSNLCDHMTFEDYHQMLIACSTSNTTHHMHSMNWMKDIKGFFLADYENIDDQISMTEKHQKQCSNFLLNCFGRHVFLVPPVELPNNLFQMAASNFAPRWVEYFSRSGSCKFNVVHWEVGQWTAVGGSSTLYFSLRY